MLTGLEEEDNPARYFHRAAGAWALAEASAAVFDQESAKALDLDAIFPGKCSPDRCKNGFDNTHDILELEIRSATLRSFGPVPTLS